MAAVSARLGLTTMASYRHVRNRADMLDGAAELVLDELTESLPNPGDDWISGVQVWMNDVRRLMVRHPWLGPLLGGRNSISPAWSRCLQRLVRVLEPSGLDAHGTARAVIWISRTTMGIVHQEVHASLEFAVDDLSALLGDSLLGDSPLGDGRFDATDAVASAISEVGQRGDDRLFDDLLEQTSIYLRSLGSRSQRPRA